jgi:sialidase-1
MIPRPPRSVFQAVRGLFPTAFATLAVALAIYVLLASAASAAQVHTYQKIFDGGFASGFHTFRIPSIVRTSNGTLVAIAECRRWNATDWGDINIVFKRSTNNGSTWSALGEVVGAGSGSWTNPTAVVNLKTGTANYGRIWLFLNWHDGSYDSISDIDAWGKRKVYTTYSDDHGATWSTPVDRTATLLPSTYKWDAMGPGIGIQTTRANVGRLIIPAQGRNIYSDNYGATWQYQLITGKTESTIVECLDGELMRNDRPGGTQIERRHVAYGTISGGFGSFTAHGDLLDPQMQASVLRYNFDAPDRIVFLNSASTVTRGKMRVRLSYDDGATWPISRRLYDWLTEQEAIDQGKGGYSSMIKTADFCVGALVEINEGGATSDPAAHRSIDFHKFNLEWIRNGQPDP